MRDRLCELHRISRESWDREGASGRCWDDESCEQTDPTLEKVFEEAQCMRQEIALLRMDVKRLAKQNGRFLTSVRRISSIKRGSNAIAQDVRVRAEGLRRRVCRLLGLAEELEERHGGERAAVRIARAQYASVVSCLHDALLECNLAEAAQRDNCKARVWRQVAILGRSVSDEQLEQMIETGRWDIFTEGLRTSRSALGKIEERHRELLALESRVRDVHRLLQQVAQLVEEQGGMLDNIEANVAATADYLGSARSEMKRAVRYERKKPWKRAMRLCVPLPGCVSH